MEPKVRIKSGKKVLQYQKVTLRIADVGSFYSSYPIPLLDVFHLVLHKFTEMNLWVQVQGAHGKDAVILVGFSWLSQKERNALLC